MNKKYVSSALHITFIYAAFGLAWIIVTDLIIAKLAVSPHQITAMQTYKGIVFVLFSTLIIFLVAYREIVMKLKAEELQQNAEKHFKALFEKSATPSVILKDGKFAEANKSALVLFGLSGFGGLANNSFSSISPEKQPDGLPSKEKERNVLGYKKRPYF